MDVESVDELPQEREVENVVQSLEERREDKFLF